jgi:hypothetical protein
MYCFCGYSVWMHFHLEHGSYLPRFSAGQHQAKAITDCPGCSASLNLMVTHLELNDARYVS